VTEYDPAAARTTGLEFNSSATASLIQRAKGQDPDAWRQLVELCGPLVYRAGLEAGLQVHDTADLVQDVFTAMVDHVSDFRGERAQQSFLAWLRTITRNKICDYFRRPKGLAAAGGPETYDQIHVISGSSESQSSDGPPAEETILLSRALELASGQFEEQTWQAFWRVVVNGQSPSHVAEDLGMTRHAVYKAKSRILSRLRHELNELNQL
jgi:RNA polymerase sigma-70 factor (ECF subfamily)